ncbi:nuclease-related domain-containing protein [Aquisalibacillus elongatus]|uniref:Nuclease-like protein n=1 Tax=Aquisalibacillus elongatus TaxID=485577 RepID=A0A3N5CB58_9BACI|nr:nuclease-related domain-containing protein [Aquisalibacillus elongatus]RPF54051.1 nuclease-like protein [Aquisalibacillus elongatus]
MIVKNVYCPPYLLQLDCLIIRLLLQHPQYPTVLDWLTRERAGFYGESQLKFPLSKLDFTHDRFHYLRLQNEQGQFFQMDWLVLTQSFILIIEAKNYSDEVIFNEDFNQVIHKEKVYQDPVLQVEEQKYQLEMWLQHHNLPQLPIVTLVVMTNSNAKLKATNPNTTYKNKIITLPKVSSKIRQIVSHYTQPQINLSDMKWISSQLLNHHQDYVPDILEKAGVRFIDLQQGVVCPSCSRLGMRLVNLRWQCDNCGLRSADAYMTALKDLFLLGKRHITKKEFMSFANVKSPDSAKKMLKRSGQKMIKNGRYTKYLLDFDYEKDFDYLKNSRRRR